MKYELTSPCGNCPFRSDKPEQKGWLGEWRAEEIARNLKRGEFPCHKTTIEDPSDEDNCSRMATNDSQHCAGALIMMEKNEESHQMMRISERFGVYDRTKLKMDAPVFDDAESFIEFHAGDD